MKELGLEHTKSYKKSARIVGEVLVNIIRTATRPSMTPWCGWCRNFPCAIPWWMARATSGPWTEIRPRRCAIPRPVWPRSRLRSWPTLIRRRSTTVPIFDATLKEPRILPAAIPNLLVNGSSGIAVGMATNMAPHNLTEVINGVAYLIDHPEATTAQLMRLVTGPDFPTGGIICGREGIKDAYETGRGKIILRAKAAIERQKGE